MIKKLVPLGVVVILIVSWKLATTGAQTELEGSPEATEQRGPNERFYTVGEKLDPGGSLYLYVDLKEALKGWMEQFGSILEQGGAPMGAAMGYAMADNAFDLLGLYGVEDLGISVVKKNEYNHMKTYVRCPGEKKGIFRLLGGGPHAFGTLDYAPPDAVLFRYVDLDAGQALVLVRNVIQTVAGEMGLAAFNEGLAKISEELGFNIEQAINSLKGEFTMFGSLDPLEKLTIPISQQQPVEFPAPRFALLTSVEDATLYDGLKAAFIKTEREVEESVQDGMRRLSIALPPSETYQLDPVLAFDGNHVFFATHSGYLDTILATKQGTENLSGQPEFQEVMEGLPDTGNGMIFVSRRLQEEIQTLIQQLATVAAESGELGPLGMMTTTQEPKGMACVRVNEPEGVFIAANSQMGGAQTLIMTGGAPMAGLMAAIAVPNFIQARSRAKVARARSEIRNLAVNLETYYIDHNTYPPAVDENGTVVPLGELGASVSAGYVPWMLTTPIAYTATLPVDPDHEKEDGTNALYRYATNGIQCWVLAGHGPDKDGDVEVADYPSPNSGQCNWRSFVSHFGIGSAVEYDATNGTTSSGDVLRVGP